MKDQTILLSLTDQLQRQIIWIASFLIECLIFCANLPPQCNKDERVFEMLVFVSLLVWTTNHVAEALWNMFVSIRDTLLVVCASPAGAGSSSR